MGNTDGEVANEADTEVAFLPSYLTTLSLPSYLLTFLPSYLPTFLPSYLPTFLPSYLPTFLYLRYAQAASDAVNKAEEGVEAAVDQIECVARSPAINLFGPNAPLSKAHEALEKVLQQVRIGGLLVNLSGGRPLHVSVAEAAEVAAAAGAADGVARGVPYLSGRPRAASWPRSSHRKRELGEFTGWSWPEHV